jgi:3-methylcrotonyl-CoA carboxylase alpha subunit
MAGNQHRSLSYKPFGKILVANRGEIACRVMRTCRRMGIETVAIYSSADGIGALHATMADEAYCIGSGPTAGESYLRGDEILEIAQRTGAQAIHPGYGFLSENANFCRNITGNGIAFVGPSPEAILAMGSKSHSKSLMEEANVPTTPGYHGSNQDPNYLLYVAVTNIGFPLLIKAVMGGGGKGIRLVWDQKDFLSALESCKRESMSAFGDVGVLLEKYLINPRHVEVQIIADTRGNVVHLFERDCSLQRRHQKVIEEAPASDLSMDVRGRLGEMGKKAAQAVNYVNAGTVEFLLDTQSAEKDFYFCEMNTRLQVEHPVTEMITNIDLVEWQLRVAAGEELPVINQNDIVARGHAFEARIYAEKGMDFLPSTGTVWYHGPPSVPNTGDSTAQVRVDTGIKTGDDIGVFYDPMISKLIVYGNDRKEALNRLIESLKNYRIAGVSSNIDFLLKCAEHPVFEKPGAINTGFIEEFMDELKPSEATNTPLCTALAAFAIILHIEKRSGVKDLNEAKQSATSPWSSKSGSWRMGGRSGRARRVLRLPRDESWTEVECFSDPNGPLEIVIRYKDNAPIECFHLDGTLGSDGSLDVLVNGVKHMRLRVLLRDSLEDGNLAVHLWSQNQVDGKNSFSEVFMNPMTVQQHGHEKSASATHGTVKAPMPGRITRVNFHEGDHVKEGEPVIVMEAMKMEHTIRAPKDGVIQKLSHNVDDVVAEAAVLFVVEEYSAEQKSATE